MRETTSSRTPTNPAAPGARTSARQSGRRPKDLTRKKIYAGLTQAEAEAAEAEHRRIMAVLTGLLLTQFLGMMANTIVGNAMPVIAAEVGARPDQYVWIITSAILANTVMTPIAGKLGDLFDKRLMLIAFIGVFVLGSLLSGLAVDAEMLIATRILQGIGMGGQVMMSIIIMATIIPPRKRGRYNGYQGAVMAVATVSGPFVGGVIVDTPWLGWRWCFFVMIPFMLLAAAVVGSRLKLPPNPRTGRARIDFLGAAIIAVGSTLLLVWISIGGTTFEWASWPSALMLGGAIVLAVLFVVVERLVPEPLIPLHILGSRTTVLAIVASLGVGGMMFGSNVFLGQYFQYGRDYSATVAGFLGLPLMFGLLIASTWSGRVVTARGTWKGVVMWGMGLMTQGTFLFGTRVHQDTSLLLTSLFLFVAGWGMGMCLQNLVLAVQNTVGLRHMGAATSSVTFFRNLGGAIAIQVFGILYARQVASHMRDAGVTMPGGDASGSTLDLAGLPDDVEVVVRAAYAEGIGPVFLSIFALALVGFVATIFMRGTSLRDTVDVERATGPAGPVVPTSGASVTTAPAGLTPPEADATLPDGDVNDVVGPSDRTDDERVPALRGSTGASSPRR
ncbi:MFS transporter [Georgenia sp. Z1491]|uniref:MFS transporter n=1 Tax=Georgenia sp. Z1491 TaxID=3416707 RepID=UPI003CEB2C24